MAIRYNEIRVRVHLDRIVANYQRMRALAPGCIPVIKADAYGHGLVRVAAALAAAGAATLAVGTVAEAVLLRQSPFAGRVVALLGPLYADDADALFAYDILPFIARYEQLEQLGARGRATRERRGRPLDVAIKCDTGMRRLGFDSADGARLAQALKKQPDLRPVMLASHLATADNPAEKGFVLAQNARFVQMRRKLEAELGQRLDASLANSAAILAYPDLRYDAPRPGIALYGANPLHGAPLAPLGAKFLPAMEVHAPVLQIHALPKGDSISYGRTFTADRDMRVAIVGAGYADAYSRGLSSATGQGAAMLLAGKRRPILGRVCMQMTAIDVTDVANIADVAGVAKVANVADVADVTGVAGAPQDEPKPGDRAYLLGGPGPQAVTPEELASWWGTIPYEVFCLLGCNLRGYGG